MAAIGFRRLCLIVAALVLQTALLRAALPGSDEAPARPSLAGQLLVAAPWIGDPRFERTVILVVEHGPGGAIGIVINKPIGETSIASVLEVVGQKGGDVTGDIRVFSGGPGPAGSRPRRSQRRPGDRRRKRPCFNDVEPRYTAGHRRQERAGQNPGGLWLRRLGT